MNIDNPTGAQLLLIQPAQKRAWVEVDAKTHWTDKVYKDATFSNDKYQPEQKEWFYSMVTLEKLPFEPRTPEMQARVIQDNLIQYNQLNKAGQL